MHGIGDFKDLQLWGRKKEYIIFRDCHMSWIASKNRFAKLYYKLYKVLFALIINKTEKYKKVFALGVEEYEYLKALGLEDSKIDYLYHGYNDEVIYYDEHERYEIRSMYRFKKDDIVISYIGKFDYAKRPDLIIDIVNNLENEFVNNKNIKLLFIGSKNNKYMKEFNSKLTELNSNIKCVIDDGKKFNELRKYFSASDICIFPKETTLSSIHAQICKCSVIMENHKSNVERVVNNNNLYPIGNLKKAAEIIKEIIVKEEEHKDYSKHLLNREYKNQINKLYDSLK